MPRSSPPSLRGPRGRALQVREGVFGPVRSWSARDAAEILGPDAATAASMSPQRRHEYLTSRAWLRQIVRDGFGRAWHGFEVVPRGAKPRLHRSALEVSIAHSDGRLFVGVAARGRIGVDLERVAPIFDQPSLARRLCSPTELTEIALLAPHARRARLAQLWTTKESYAKALGHGLSLDFTSVEAAQLHRRSGVRRVLAPRSTDAHFAYAITWADAAPSPRSPLSSTVITTGSGRKDTE